MHAPLAPVGRRRSIALTFNLPMALWFVGSSPGSAGATFSTFFSWYNIVLTPVWVTVALAPAGAMLMWLPSGMTRQSLGSDFFGLLARRALAFALAYSLAVSITEWLANRPIRLMQQPAAFLVLIGFSVFIAGWTAAFYRVNQGWWRWSSLIFGAAAIYSVPLNLIHTSGYKNNHDFVGMAYFGLACLLAAGGVWLGHTKSSHWRTQEMSALFQPPKWSDQWKS
jgi:hypothetical protein